MSGFGLSSLWGGSFRRNRIGGLCLALTVALSAGSAIAQGRPDTPPMAIAIPAQPLAQAIVAFNVQTGLQIVAPADLVAGLSTSGLQGSYTPEQALRQLLAGTGLTHSYADTNTVTLERAGLQPESGPVRLGPVTVTARRTEELLQDVPGSVVVLTDEELRRSNVGNATDVLSRLPNVGFLSGSDPNTLPLSIRGVSNLAGAGTSGPTNGVFSNGILLNPTGQAFGIDPNLVDLERVEAVFGPQGTAFGSGTIGGAINFVTKKPTEEFEASLETEIGSFPDGRGTAIVNSPILDKGLLSARLVAFGGISDGFVDFENVSDPDSIGRDDIGVRLSLRSQPTNRLTLDTSVSFDRTEYDAENEVPIDRFDDDDLVSEADFVGEGRIDRLLTSFEWVYDLDRGSIRSTTSFLQNESEIAEDTDFSQIDFDVTTGTLEERAIAQEVRFESESFTLPAQSGEVSFNLGVSTNFSEFERDILSDPGSDAFALFGELDDGSTTLSSSKQNVFNVGLFGDARWRPIPALEIGFGARFSRDRVRQEGEVLTSGLSALASPPVPFASEEAIFTAVTPSASIKYDWSENFSTYFTFSTGYRPGGFSALQTGLSGFEEESVLSYEGGFRASLFDDRLLVTGSGYLLDYDDIQVTTVDDGGSLPVFRIDNAAAARSVGSEIGVSVLPTQGLRIDAQMGLNFTKFTDFTDSVFGDITGTRLPTAPVHTLSLVGDYEHPREILPGARGFLRAEYNFQSSFRDRVDPSFEPLDGFDVLNLRIGLRSENYAVEAFVENALDEIYATNQASASALGFGPATVEVGPPRHFGVRARLQF